MSYRTTEVLSLVDIDNNMRIIDEDYENLTEELEEEKNNIKRMIYAFKRETRSSEKINYQKNQWCEGAAFNKLIDDKCSEYNQSLLTIN